MEVGYLKGTIYKTVCKYIGEATRLMQYCGAGNGGGGGYYHP